LQFPKCRCFFFFLFFFFLLSFLVYHCFFFLFPLSLFLFFSLTVLFFYSFYRKKTHVNNKRNSLFQRGSNDKNASKDSQLLSI
jgi:Ca2+/Na+ antiporter